MYLDVVCLPSAGPDEFTNVMSKFGVLGKLWVRNTEVHDVIDLSLHCAEALVLAEHWQGGIYQPLEKLLPPFAHGWVFQHVYAPGVCPKVVREAILAVLIE